MNRKLIALTLTAAVCSPALVLADESTVSIYGNLRMDFQNAKADGAASGTNLSARNRVTQNSSYIGFRGAEDLGGKLKATWQVEQGLALDAGTSSSSTGTWATRNSKVGLAGNFGEIFLGNWDTPYKLGTTGSNPKIDAFYNTTIAYNIGIMSGNSSPTGSNTSSRNGFDRRQNNSVQYVLPKMGGFGGRVAYSANEEKTSTANPNLWSILGTYSTDALYIGLAYERHNDYANTTTEDTKDAGVKLAASYTFAKATTIGLIAEQLKYKGNLASGSATTSASLPKVVTLGGATEAKVNAFYLSLVHKMGPHYLRAAYAWDTGVNLSGGTASDDSKTKAKMYAIGYSYDFSKRTELYALYSKIKNEENSYNNFGSNGLGLTSANAGADSQGFGVGLRHSF